jgi:hypothetical protein
MQDKLNIVWGYSLVAKSIIRSYKLNIDGPWVRFSVSPFIFCLFLPTFYSQRGLSPRERLRALSPPSQLPFYFFSHSLPLRPFF